MTRRVQQERLPAVAPGLPVNALPGAIDRRRFLSLMGTTIAMAGCGGPPEEKIVPYVRQPEQIVPGKPLYYATAMELGGYAAGLLVESHLGRPTKVEGNPDHPASRGATDVFAQASVLDLYDPDRSQVVTRRGQISTWQMFLSALKPALAAQDAKQGAGLRILTETVTSPTLAAQLKALLDKYPQARWHRYEPISRENIQAGARLAFGEDLNVVYHLDQADVILALDADFLNGGPGHVRYAWDFASRRQGRRRAELSRLYVVEPSPTVTGARADHRLPLRASQVAGFAAEVARRLGIDVLAPHPSTIANAPPKWFAAVVKDLRTYRLASQPGGALVIAGDRQPPVVHALAHAINDKLGSVRKTVTYTEPIEAQQTGKSDIGTLAELADDLRAGEVDLLVILGGNPAFTAPADVGFAEALRELSFPKREERCEDPTADAARSVHLGLYHDETSALCEWHLPQTHFLESWGDTRAYDGTATIIQPLIAPLYNGRSPQEVLAALLGRPGPSDYSLVREYWKSQRGEKDFETYWQTSLHDGVVARSTAKEIAQGVELKSDRIAKAAKESLPDKSNAEHAASELEVNFYPDPSIWDGRFANNGWLQELPKPLTKLTWDNAALVSPGTARDLGLANETVVELKFERRTLEIPVLIVPGHADGCVSLHLGHGRERAGRVGNNTGFDAFRLRTSDALWFADGLALRKTGRRYPLAITQHHHRMEGRDLVRSNTLNNLPTGHHAHEASLYPADEHPYPGYKWGMVIDLGACTGCNACVIACQAENNIPVVGKTEVARGREMHWIRIDQYFSERTADGEPRLEFYPQPVPCMHCEQAPCELVCPVAATVHSSEGLNDMVYNRCVGTRYCSNNCPYKVRRFNFLDYTETDSESLKLLHNPDVTVRERGVMEKCTYCVQRISAARIEAEKSDHPRRAAGEGPGVVPIPTQGWSEEDLPQPLLLTACQQACPSRAIHFGDLNDERSRVHELAHNPLHYALLDELGTRPRTTYLAALRNPSPVLEDRTNEP